MSQTTNPPHRYVRWDNRVYNVGKPAAVEGLSDGLMKRSADSSQWVFFLTVAFLFGTVLLRSLLLYQDSPVLGHVLRLLATWLVLFAGEAATSPRWPGVFPIYLVIQTIVVSYSCGSSISRSMTIVNVFLGFYALATQRAQAARETNRHLGAYSTQLEQLAVARELHDSVTQTIFSMNLTTQSALLLLDRDPQAVGTDAFVVQGADCQTFLNAILGGDGAPNPFDLEKDMR
jgi:signal transduction histidine kinase